MRTFLQNLRNKFFGINFILPKINEIARDQSLIRTELAFLRKDLLKWASVPARVPLFLASSSGVAADSVDHIVPKGTSRDNTRWPRLAIWAEEFFGRKIRFLDLGCSGGGVVFDLHLGGHAAAGVEGSDLSARFERAEWGTIGQHLFVSDITKDFELREAGGTGAAQFDLITAWEVLEHIPQNLLEGLFRNIDRHLAAGGVFAASVATFEDMDAATGLRWHQTVKPKAWWLEEIRRVAPDLVEVRTGWRTKDFPRGSGNPNIPWDWDADAVPSLGFHLVMQKR